MKHYQTRIAFAEKEIKRCARAIYIIGSDFTISPDYYIYKLNQANRIRKHYIAKNYEYVRARMKDKRECRAKELGDFNNPLTPLG